MKKSGIIGPSVKVLAFVAVVGVCLALIVNALRTPVPGAKGDFTAVISDVSGLHDGNDVRMSGVQVGKVDAIELRDGLAYVGFSVLSSQTIFDNTKVAVRYQNLVGQRYLELVQPDRPGAIVPSGSTIPIAQTVPSFDVSKLFNGFAPLFDTLDPKALNTFAENMLNVIQGDGSGFGPALNDIEKLATMANDKQQFILVIVRNLDNVAKSIAGKSQRVGDLVRQMLPIAANLDNRADEIHQSAVTANEVVLRAADLADQMQATYDGVYGPLHDFLFRLTPLSKEVQTALRLAPSLLTAMSNGMKGVSTPVAYSCSKGQRSLPGIGSLIVASQRLVVCR